MPAVISFGVSWGLLPFKSRAVSTRTVSFNKAYINMFQRIIRINSDYVLK
jgi:hypothetical protein